MVEYECVKYFSKQLFTLSETKGQDRQYTYNVTIRRDRVNIVTAHRQRLLRVLSVCL